MVRIPFLSKGKTASATGGENMEGEPTVVVEEKPKTSSDFFREYPSHFHSELQYKDEKTLRGVRDLVDRFEKADPSLLIFQEPFKSAIMTEADYRRRAEIFRDVLGEKFGPTFFREVEVPRTQENEQQYLRFRVNPTNYTDIWIVRTEDTLRKTDAPPGSSLQHKMEKTFAVKRREDDVQVLHERQPGDGRFDSSLKRIDPFFAESFVAEAPLNH